MWSNTYVTNIRCTTVLQKRVVRLVWGTYQHLFTLLCILRFVDQVKFKTAIIMYKPYHNVLPNILQNMFKLYVSTHGTRHRYFHKSSMSTHGTRHRYFHKSSMSTHGTPQAIMVLDTDTSTSHHGTRHRYLHKPSWYSTQIPPQAIMVLDTDTSTRHHGTRHRYLHKPSWYSTQIPPQAIM